MSSGKDHYDFSFADLEADEQSTSGGQPTRAQSPNQSPANPHAPHHGNQGSPQHPVHQNTAHQAQIQSQHQRHPQGQLPPPANTTQQITQQTTPPRIEVPLSQRIKMHTPKAAKKTAVVSAKLMVVLSVLTLVLVAAGYWRISQSPISIAYLARTMETALERELDGISVNIDDAIVQRTPGNHGIAFRLKGMSFRNADGAVIAQAPLAAVSLSGLAMMRGRVAPNRISLIQPRILMFYSERDGLALSFSKPDTGEAPAASTQNAQSLANVQQVNITRAMSQAFAAARSKQSATAFLKGIGIKDATVIFDHHGKRSFWQVPEFTVGVEHLEQASYISGKAKVASGAGPWGMSFRVAQTEQDDNFSVAVQVDDFVPRGLAQNFPALAFLQSFGFPLTAQAKVVMDSHGALKGGEAKLNLTAGLMGIPGLSDVAVKLDKGIVSLRYDTERGQIDVLPSEISAAGSRITVFGAVRDIAKNPDQPNWQFDLRGRDGQIAAPDDTGDPLKIDVFKIAGQFDQARERITLSEAVIKAGGGRISVNGLLTSVASSPGVQVEATMSAMKTETFKYFWPEFVAGESRGWFLRNVSGGRITAGQATVRMTGAQLSEALNDGEIPSETLQMQIDGDSLVIDYLDGSPPILTGFVTARMAGKLFQIDVPNANLLLPDGAAVKLRKGVFLVQDHRPKNPDSRLTLQFDTKMNGMFSLLRQPAFTELRPPDITTSDFRGAMNGLVQIDIPLRSDVKLSDLQVRGQARLTKLSHRGGFGKFSLNGGNVQFDLTERAINARGDILVNGVSAKLAWQRIFGEGAGRQPPLRITAVLDNADRQQLGLNINHIIRGEVPFGVNITPGKRGEKPEITVQANLTKAEVMLSNVGWRKQRGRAASVQFRLADGKKGGTELQDFKVFGEDISIDGWIGIDENQQFSSFYFPDFSFNVITHLELKGTLDKRKIWNVTARGSSYDGREFFRSLFSAGQISGALPKEQEDSTGVDLTAEIATLVGFSEATLRNVKITARNRGGKLTSLLAKGQFAKGKSLSVKLTRKGKGPRILRAQSTDAGSAFRLVGFYPSVLGGETSLEVNLDAGKVTEKQGILWARNFRILGDPVVQEVLANAGETSSVEDSGGRRVTRAVYEFERMRVPFQVGSGQFVLRSSYINGPLIGATLRGKVDFKRETVDLSGTYVPLYGINSVLGELPIIGELFRSRPGEGLLGITFAVIGPLSKPDVQVNPISMVAPGFLRQIFEFQRPKSIQITPDNPVKPARSRRKRRTKPGAASSLPAQTGPTVKRRKNQGTSWSTETRPQ